MKKQLLPMLLVFMLCWLPALAGGENTTKNFPDDFTDGKFVQSSGISTFALTREETIADALEDGDFALAPKERLTYDVPDGLVVIKEKSSIEDGRITLTIDLQASDWGKLLLSSSPYPYVSVRHSLDCPDKNTYETHTGFSGWFADETVDYVLDLMDDGIHWDSGNQQSSNGVFVAEIVPDQSLLMPQNGGTGMNLIAWLDANDQSVRYYEYYEVVINIVDTSSFHIPFRYVNADTLSATSNSTLPSGVTVQSCTDGDLTLLNTLSTATDITISLKAPSGASYMILTKPEHLANEQHAVSGGVASFEYQLHPNCNTEEQITVGWYNSSNELVDYGIFMLHAEPSFYAAWPYYESDWKAVPSNRISLTNNAASVGVTFTYNATTGDLHIGYNDEATITGEWGSCIAKIKAPEGAKYYRTNHSGGNNIMGEDSGAADDQMNFTSAQELQPVPADGWIEIMDYQPIREINVGPVTLYLQIGEGGVWPYAGGVFSIFWYNSEEQAKLNDGKSPNSIEYVSDTMGALCVTSRFDVVESEDKINGPVQNITCVGTHEKHKHWRLRIRRYPHKGTNAHHYELVMENEYGAYQPIPSGESLIFYMPYPSGHEYGDGHTYEIYHYNDDYSSCQKVTATPCAKGIRFEVSSLSPFVLDWGNYNEDDLLPDQGNDGNQGDDSGSSGGNNGGSTSPERYHLHNLNMQPGHLVNMQNVRVKRIDAYYQGNSTIQGGYIDWLFISYSNEDMEDLPTQGLHLNGTEINALEFSLSTNATTPTFSEPFIHLANNTVVGVLLIDSKLPALSTWLTYDNTVKILTVAINGGSPISFAEYLAQQGGTN